MDIIACEGSVAFYYFIATLAFVATSVAQVIVWIRRASKWKAYMRPEEGEPKAEMRIGVRRIDESVHLVTLDMRADNYENELAKALSEARDRATVLNYNRRMLKEAS